MFQCRLCGEDSGNPQGRGAHEAFCARKRGAKIIGKGPERHFITADGKNISAPNATRKPSVAVDELGGSGPCNICGEKDFKNLVAHQVYHIRRKEAKWVNGISQGPDRVMEPTNLGHERFAGFLGRTSLVQASDVPEDIESPEQRYAADASQTHQASLSIQKAAALLQFSVFMENVGPLQALAMVTGMSKIGKSLRR